MHGDILIILVLLVLGVAAFFFGVIYAVYRVLASVGRGIAHLLWPRRVPCSPRVPAAPAARPARSQGRRTFRVCLREQCRHVEHRPARFCSQCGAKLPEAD